MNVVYTRQVRIKLTKGLLELIILSLLNAKPTHGYQLISDIRKTFGVYFGPSTIYPLLNALEKGGYVKSEWSMIERPRKVYKLTATGQNLLSLTEETLNLIYRKLALTRQLESQRINFPFLFRMCTLNL